MAERRLPRGRARWWLSMLFLFLAPAAGCQVEEALIDGFYGGISDTVATVVADALLTQIDGP